jgi:uncharacterized NAD(P)/FAD-binding protein YdhS
MNEIAVSIIGAGASGLISLNRIVEKFSRRAPEGAGLKVYLFDRSGVFGTGVAYSTPLPSHLLNVRAAGMSAILDDPLHFVKWLQAEASEIEKTYPGLAIGEDTFAPRKLYGRYLASLFHETVATAKEKNIRIEFIKGEAVRVEETPDGIELVLGDGARIRSRFLVLAMGNFPSTLYQELGGVPGYFPYPWPAGRLTEVISPNRPVCILGAGLSAVDSLLTLLDNGHREKIYFVSRKGLLPKVQCPAAEYTPRFVTPEAIDRLTEGGRVKTDLDSVGRLFMQEIEAAEGGSIDWFDFISPRGDVQEMLEQDIRAAKAGPIGWQTALMATRPLHPRLWDDLRPEDQRRFDREFKSLWNHYRVPLSMVNAEKVLGALKSGQVSVLAGINHVRHLGESDGFRLTIGSRLGPDYPLDVPYLVNATGQGFDVTRFQDRFIEALLESGVVVPHPSGGLQVDFNTCAVIHRDGRKANTVFALGELTRGVHFFTNAVSENARYAELIAGQITAAIAGSESRC